LKIESKIKLKISIDPSKVLSRLLQRRAGPDFGNPENLTNEERLSRLLHNPKASKPPSDGPIYEHFLIIGPEPFVPDSEPVILYQHPQDIPISIPRLPSFCFPGGMTTRKVDKSGFSEGDFLQILFNSDHPDHPENSFVFLLTTEDEQVVYGVCITKDEILNGGHIDKWDTRKEFPSYARLVAQSSEGNDLIFAPRCYCLLTRYPFLRLHFAVLNDILALEYSGNTTIQKDKKHLPRIKDDGAGAPPSPSLEVNGDMDEGDFGGNKAIWILNKYRKLTVHKAREQGSVTFRSVRELPPIHYKRPPGVADEEAEALCQFALPITFHQLSKDQFFTVLSCILVERKVIFFSPNLHVLTAVVLAWIALIRPFVYQSVFIPILPQSLYTMLSAPVPYIIGINSLPPKGDIPPDVVLVDIDHDRVRLNEAAPPLPRWKELEIKVKPLGKELMREFYAGGNTSIPYTTTPSAFHLVEELSTLIKTHFQSLFTDFHKHCIRDLTDNNKPITVFHKDSFLSETPKADQPFFKAFLQTQTFFAYSDQRLRKADTKEANQLL